MADPRKVIAIVDDNQPVLEAIQRLLIVHGFDAQSFTSAEAFLDSPAADNTACLVLDILLDGMSGFELHRRLAAARSTLPIIFITAADDENIPREAVKLGRACLRKPFSASLLISEIGKASA